MNSVLNHNFDNILILRAQENRKSPSVVKISDSLVCIETFATVYLWERYPLSIELVFKVINWKISEIVLAQSTVRLRTSRCLELNGLLLREKNLATF